MISQTTIPEKRDAQPKLGVGPEMLSRVGYAENSITSVLMSKKNRPQKQTRVPQKERVIAVNSYAARVALSSGAPDLNVRQNQLHKPNQWQ